MFDFLILLENLDIHVMGSSKKNAIHPRHKLILLKNWVSEINLWLPPFLLVRFLGVHHQGRNLKSLNAIFETLEKNQVSTWLCLLTYVVLSATFVPYWLQATDTSLDYGNVFSYNNLFPRLICGILVSCYVHEIQQCLGDIIYSSNDGCVLQKRSDFVDVVVSRLLSYLWC